MAKGDDDIFVVPQMLAAYAALLTRLAAQPGREHLVAGTFDWFNFKPATLDTVGWGRMRAGAALVSSPSLVAPQLRNRCRGNGFCNCSAGGGGYVYDGWDLTEARQPREPRLDKRTCVGPFAFANGALKFFSTATVRWLVRSEAFEADIRYAEELANASAGGDGGGGGGSGGGTTARWRRRERRRGRSEDGGGSERPRLAARVSEDAQLGVWLAALPSLHLVVFKRFEGWLNSFHHVGDLRHLLVAHRTPWDLYAWLLRHTTALWRDATELRVHTKCTPSPPCKECLHHQSQTTCALHTKLRVRRGGTRVNCAACRCAATTANGTSVGESPGRCLWHDRIGNADPTISSCAA